ncbi:condensation domain protein [Mycobacterium xenopi 4042]|uniref:Condensation domain protein n=1 Tax=Mycobacterium xenopi 4042 TaxID=1299334 RepID=X8AM80_MYCXE|nr:condensation domain protein [Mycobacterium xenopi 4042]
MRAKLFVVTEDEHVLVAVVHHIAADGWSTSLLVRDLGIAYAARCAGRAPAWDPLAVQYADYTLWQREQLGDLDDPDSQLASQLAYWQHSLAGLPEQLVLPTDRPYPPVADYRGARVAVDWPAELQQRVGRVAREHKASSFMVIQAALALLLAKLSATADVAVGFPIAGRRDPALDELVGFFVNTLVLRVDVAGNPTTGQLLAQVRARSLAAYEHQDVPFELLVERLNPARSLTHHPLVQVMLAWQNNTPAELSLGEVQASPLPVHANTARMDLTFSLAERWTKTGEPAGIGGLVEFRTDVFDAASIEALIERFKTTVLALTADPSRRLSSIDLLDDTEHAYLDVWANRAALTRPARPGVDTRGVRRAGRPPPAGGGADLRRRLADLPGAGRGRQPVGALAGRSRGGSGTACGAAVFAFGRGDRGDFGGAQNRGRVCADRPGAPAGAGRLPARRCRTDRRDHHRGAGRPARRA